MADNSAIDFTIAFNEANALYDADKLEKCIEKARELLDKPAIPRLHRIKTLMLLASTVGDWLEAKGYLEDADLLWRIVRRWQPKGENLQIDETLDELRTILDELHKVLAEEEPCETDYEEDVDEERVDEENIDEENVDEENIDEGQ